MPETDEVKAARERVEAMSYGGNYFEQSMKLMDDQRLLAKAFVSMWSPDAISKRKQAIRSALIKIADNVCKHLIQRDGWSQDDKCFQVDLQEAENEILEATT